MEGFNLLCLWQTFSYISTIRLIIFKSQNEE